MKPKLIRKLLTLAMQVMVIIIMALSVTGNATAAGTQPFVGIWRAIDFDESSINIKITGPVRNQFNITWTESYISFCDGQIGLATGKGWLNPEDQTILEADMNLVCFLSGDSVQWHQVWQYRPTYNVLASQNDYGVETIWTRPGKPVVPRLNLRVNYGHDWVESFYEAGHTVWVTVQDGEDNIKATSEVITDESGYFQTPPESWDPGQPDIQPGDWVYAQVDNGQTAKVQIGEISGRIDFESNSISSTISAPWVDERTPADFDYFKLTPSGGSSWEDNFDNLLDEDWSWINENSNNWEFADESSLRIYASSGRTGAENLLLLPVDDFFRIETYLSFKPRRDFQFAGLVIWQDESNFLQFGRAFCDVEGCPGEGVYFDNVGGITQENFALHDESGGIYLSLVRDGNEFSAYDSSDGENWNYIGTHSVDDGFQVNAVGLTSAQDFFNNVECHSWGADLPEEIVVFDSVHPDGQDVYSCQWNEEDWNIQPGQDVGVAYTGLDGHWVANAFVSTARIDASVTNDFIRPAGFTPWATLNISIYESKERKDLGDPPIWEGSRDADGSGSVDVDHGLDLVPGNYLTVSDAVATKGLILELITADIFDTGLELMAGTAPAGRDVWVAAGPAEWQEGFWVQSDPLTGAWSADFTSIGFDMTEEMGPWSYARIFDEDGDVIEADVPPLETWFVSFTITGPSFWDEGAHHYTFYLNGNELEDLNGEVLPPFEFTASPDASLSFDGFVLLRPSALRICVDGGLQTMDPVLYTDQATRFNIGYVTDYPKTFAGAQSDFDSLNLEVSWDGGERVTLERSDIMEYSEENWTAYLCGLNAPSTIYGSAANDWFWAINFLPNTTLDISIYESPDMESKLWQGNRDTDGSGSVGLGYPDFEINLQPGYTLVISDDSVQKELTLENITFELMQPDTEKMAGIAPVGKDIQVTAGYAAGETQQHLVVTADPQTGIWMADFSAVPDFDMDWEMRWWSFAQIFDEDGDVSQADFTGYNPGINADVPENWFWVGGFRPNSTLFISTFESSDPGAASLCTNNEYMTDGNGFAAFGYPDFPCSLEAGKYLVVSDGINQKELVLEEILMQTFDPETNIITGIAKPYSELDIAVELPEGTIHLFPVYADENGNWEADLTGTVDLTDEMWIMTFVSKMDEDGDYNIGNRVQPISAIWIGSFTYTVPFTWAYGQHQYTFYLDGNPVTAPYNFWATYETNLNWNGYVLMEPTALRFCIGDFLQVNPPAFYIDQATRFNVGVITESPITFEEAKSYFDSLIVEVSWDEEQAIRLEWTDIILDEEYNWYNYLCGLTAP